MRVAELDIQKGNAMMESVQEEMKKRSDRIWLEREDRSQKYTVELGRRSLFDAALKL